MFSIYFVVVLGLCIYSYKDETTPTLYQAISTLLVIISLFGIGSDLVGIVTVHSGNLIKKTYEYYKYTDTEGQSSTSKKCQTTDGIKICIVNTDKETEQYITVKDYEFLEDLDTIESNNEEVFHYQTTDGIKGISKSCLELSNSKICAVKDDLIEVENFELKQIK